VIKVCELLRGKTHGVLYQCHFFHIHNLVECNQPVYQIFVFPYLQDQFIIIHTISHFTKERVSPIKGQKGRSLHISDHYLFLHALHPLYNFGKIVPFIVYKGYTYREFPECPFLQNFLFEQ